nr:ABC transporter permease [Pseudomonas sp.]
MNWLTQAARMTLRDWRAGELRLILVALVVAVAAVTSVGFLADRLQLALERDGAQLLGADLVLSTQAPAGSAIRDAASARRLQMADTVVFPSMALAGGADDQQAQLVSVKAVGSGYPLRGAITLRHAE